ncbi:MAG TPA: metallopeptidase TldD-related protein [Patescibacteria group bacterium]|nr:metallopeptidase TldD-related protein [Patescibacteria group bacterium]
MEAVLAAARQAGCVAAEVFVKDGRGRQVTLEPSSAGEPPCRLVSRTREAGAALRVVDRDGRAGFAWAGLGDPIAPADLVDAARRSPAPGREPAPAPDGLAAAPDLAPADGLAAADAATAGVAPAMVRALELDLVDPDCLRSGDDAVIERMQEGVAEVGRSGEAMVEIDRIVVAEASTRFHFATSGGMRESFERTLAMLSIALVPAAPEARAVVEERTSCRLADLDLAECAREAILRSLPEREAGEVVATGAAPSAETIEIVLEPRAAASLVAALAPSALSGGFPEIRRPSALTLYDDAIVAGRPSSAPFDGAGRPTSRRILVEGGRPTGRIEPGGAHFLRPSYRDLPASGPAALVVAPGVRVSGQMPEGASGGGLSIRAAIIDIAPGAEWTVRVRRGDFWNDGKRLGPADGLFWEGSPARLIQAVSETGDDPRWYQCGPSICTPSLTLRGLSTWRREARAGI